MKIKNILKSDFLRKISETFFVQFLVVAMNFFSALLISRTLGPTFRGMYAVAVTLSMVGIQFGNLGLQSANTYFIAKNPSSLPFVFGNALLMSLGLGALCSFITWFFCFFSSNDPLLEGNLLYLAIFWIPLGLAYMLFQNMLLAVHEVRSFNKSELMAKLFNFITILSLVFAGCRNVSLIFLMNYFSILLSFFYILKIFKKHLKGKPQFSFAVFKEGFSYASRVYLSCFISFFLIRCDLLFVKHYLGFEKAGYYSVASTGIDVISIFPKMVGTLLFPKLTSFEQKGEKFEYIKKIALFTAIFLCCFSGILFFIAEPFIHFIYGEQFLEATPIFLWLLPGMVFISIDRLLSSYFGSIGMPLITIFSPLIALFIKVILNVKWGFQTGAIGIAICSSIGYLVMLMMSLIYLYATRHQRKAFEKIPLFENSIL